MNTLKQHKWWHFIYGKEFVSEVVSENISCKTSNFWYICKKCKCQIGEKEGCTTFSFFIEISPKSNKGK